MVIVISRHLNNIVTRTSYEHNTKSLPSWTTIDGRMKDFRMRREEATIPLLTWTMMQHSISYVCVGSTHTARGSHCDLEGAIEHKNFSSPHIINVAYIQND